MSNKVDSAEWSTIITPKRSYFDFKIKELIRYRDLLWMFVKKDIITVYKQTILGPIWYVLQPIMTMLTFVFIFGKVANLPTDGIPKPVYYLAGIVLWNFFKDTFLLASTTFFVNAEVFSKVYFPRLIVPFSQAISGLIKFAIQFAMFMVLLYGWYIFYKGVEIQPNIWMLALPVLLLLMAMLSLGFGLLFSALTTKYRDFKFLLQFGVQLVMYFSSIIYPMSQLKGVLKDVIWFNPIAHIIEIFKYGFLGEGEVTGTAIIYTIVFSIVIFILGVLSFNKTEKDFVDTV